MEENELPDDLAKIRHINTYSAPLNYFDGLAEEIIGKVYLPLAADMPLSAPPVNYFDKLADTILLKIKTASAQNEVQKELEELEPLLTTISKRNLYRVPDGYFDSFAVTIPVSETEKPASIIKMPRSKKSWLSYAAAAVVAAVIAMTVVFSVEQDRGGVDPAAYSQALAKVSDNELYDYLDQTAQDADIAPASQEEEGTNGEGIFNILLNNVTDTELENYLNENDNSDEKNIKGI